MWVRVPPPLLKMNPPQGISSLLVITLDAPSGYALAAPSLPPRSDGCAATIPSARRSGGRALLAGAYRTSPAPHRGGLSCHTSFRVWKPSRRTLPWYPALCRLSSGRESRRYKIPPLPNLSASAMTPGWHLAEHSGMPAAEPDTSHHRLAEGGAIG